MINFTLVGHTPEIHMRMDEIMIPSKAFSSIKQYLPKKQKKMGFKIWVRVGSSGYVYCFEPFQGAKKLKETISELGTAGDVVMRFVII